MALVRGTPQLLVETDADGGLGFESRDGRTVRVVTRDNHAAEHAEMGVAPIPLPRHHDIASVGNLDIGAATVPSGVTLSVVDDPTEFGGKVLKFSTTGVVSSKIVIIPLLSNLAEYPRAYPNIIWRVKYDANTSRLYVGAANDAAAANRYFWIIMEPSTTITPYGNKGAWAATKWQGNYRSYHTSPYRNFYTSGAPESWGISSPRFEVRALYFSISSTASSDIYLSRAYSPEWDKARITIQGDGGYTSFITEIGERMRARGYPGVLSKVLAESVSYATDEEFADYCANGWDVITHLSTSPVVNSISDATTANLLAEYLARGRAFHQKMRLQGSLLSWVSCYQNTQAATHAFATYATNLRENGVLGARGRVVDPEYGLSPFNDTTGYCGLAHGNGEAPQFYVPPLGRYNRLSQACGGTGSAVAKDDYASSPAAATIAKCVAGKEYGYLYAHRFEGSLADPPADGNNTPNFAINMMASIDSLVRAKLLDVVPIRQIEASTYDRPGDVYLRWDGEWVSRTTGKIAL